MTTLDVLYAVVVGFVSALALAVLVHGAARRRRR